MRSSIFLILLSFSVFSQNKFKSINQDSLNTWQLLKYDGKAAWGGFKFAASRPAHWDKDQWITAGTIIGGTLALTLLDEEADRWFSGQEEDIPLFIKDFGWRSGSPQITYGFTGSVYLFGLLTKNEKIRETGVLMITSATVAGLIQTIAKASVGRARPRAEEGPYSFNPFSGEAAYRSFPSGHTILTFTAAYAIGKQFDNPWIKAGVYTIGMIAPVSRLWEGAHWLTDVGLSMAISIVTVDAIDNYLKKTQSYKSAQRKDGISWRLHLGLGKAGITGTF